MQVTERVSASADGTKGNDDSVAATLSADGRLVAFESWADNLVPGDTNGWAAPAPIRTWSHSV